MTVVKCDSSATLQGCSQTWQDYESSAVEKTMMQGSRLSAIFQDCSATL